MSRWPLQFTHFKRVGLKGSDLELGRKSCKWFRIFCACRPMIYLQFLLFVSHIFFADILITWLTWSKEMVFCYQNCSDLLWEKNVLVIEKNLWNSRLKAEKLQIFCNHLSNLFKQWKVRTISGNRMLF